MDERYFEHGIVPRGQHSAQPDEYDEHHGRQFLIAMHIDVKNVAAENGDTGKQD